MPIECNTLHVKQASAIIEDKPVRGSQKEIADLRGAIKVYGALAEDPAHNLDDWLAAHTQMTQEITGLILPMFRLSLR